MVDLKGFEPLPRESKSRLLPLQHRSICKSNRIRTYTLGFVNQCAIHYTINLLHSFLRLLLYRERDSNSQKTASKTAAYAIPPPLHFVPAVGLVHKTAILYNGVHEY